MAEYFKLKIGKVKRETEDSVSITFDIPEYLRETFKYKHGQFITIKTEFDNKPVSRAYSISSCPFYDDDLTVTIKEIEKGFVSAYLNQQIKSGDILEVLKPRGKFTVDLSPEAKRTHILFAAGSGITPIMSILKSILFVEKESRVILVYSNRNEDTIIFKDELSELEAKYSDRFKIIHIFSRPAKTNGQLIGRINKEISKKIISNHFADEDNELHFYMCGPQGMMQEIQSVLDELDVDKKFIHKESFNSGKNPGCDNKVELTIPKVNMEDETNKARKVKVNIYSEEHFLDVNPDETLLDAALREGYDPPFSCQIGACATCRAKLVNGKVEMDERDALTDEEIEEGYILTCQAHPVSDDVHVDYDDQY